MEVRRGRGGGGAVFPICNIFRELMGAPAAKTLKRLPLLSFHNIDNALLRSFLGVLLKY
jgi:hypothetical protein